MEISDVFVIKLVNTDYMLVIKTVTFLPIE